MDLHCLPKLCDSISYIYIERAIIEQDNLSIVIINSNGRTPIPITATTCLLLGPGTSITHAAIKTISENGCMVLWCGEGSRRFYAAGLGETRSAKNILLQAKLCMNDETHLEVAKRMYERRFPELPKGDYTIEKLRGLEGVRVKTAYKLSSRLYGIPWKGRNYDKDNWQESDPINRALSIANTVLYGVCHSAIVSLGFSPALGFVHTGKALSFVYDIADLYKADLTIPTAFSCVSSCVVAELDSKIRKEMHRRINQYQLMKKIPGDIEWIFSVEDCEKISEKATGDLWDIGNETISGGKNYALEDDYDSVGDG